MKTSLEDLRRRFLLTSVFDVHARPDPSVMSRQRLRDAIYRLATELVDLCPDSANARSALDSLGRVQHFADASLAEADALQPSAPKGDTGRCE